MDLPWHYPLPCLDDSVWLVADMLCEFGTHLRCYQRLKCCTDDDYPPSHLAVKTDG